MKKIIAFQYLDGADQKRIGYTYNETDDNGNIIKSNIRKSVVIKDSNTIIIQAINTLMNFLIDEKVEQETNILQEKVASLENDNIASLEAITEIYEQLLALQSQITTQQTVTTEGGTI